MAKTKTEAAPSAETKPAKKAPAKKAAAPLRKPTKAEKVPTSWVVLEGASIQLDGSDVRLGKKYLRDLERQRGDGISKIEDRGKNKTTITFESPAKARKFFNGHFNGEDGFDGIEDGDDTGWKSSGLKKASAAIGAAMEDEGE